MSGITAWQRLSQVQRMRRPELRERVLNFCQENPEVVDTCGGIARWVGCGDEEIRPVLELLVEEGLLLRRGSGAHTIYFATNRQGVRRERRTAAQKRGKKREG